MRNFVARGRAWPRAHRFLDDVIPGFGLAVPLQQLLVLPFRLSADLRRQKPVQDDVEAVPEALEDLVQTNDHGQVGKWYGGTNCPRWPGPRYLPQVLPKYLWSRPGL